MKLIPKKGNTSPVSLYEHRPGLIWEIQDYIMIAIGTLLYAGGVSLFMLPYQLTTGGVSGVASIIFYATQMFSDSPIPVAWSYGAINCLFLIVGVKILGWRFCLKTIWGVVTCTMWYSVWAFFLQDPVTGAFPQICGTQSFMACVIGAIINGLGLSFCFLHNGSTGGTDIIAACINKYKDISLGQVILLCDVIIISSCYFVFHDVERVIFGYVMMIVCAQSLDFFIRKQYQAVEIKVYSKNYEHIADAINNAGFGVTVMDGTGWYTKADSKVIVSVCSKRYQSIIMRVIKTADPEAFVSVANIASVFGNGFSTMK